MWQELYWENRQTYAVRLREHRRKIQTSIAFILRESPCTLRRSEDFRSKIIECTGSTRKQPAWHVYKILLAYPSSEFLPSGVL
jgi:hypothetical protein